MIENNEDTEALVPGVADNNDGTGAEEGKKPRKSRKRIIFGICCGVLALVLAGVGIAAAANRTVKQPVQAQAPPSPSASPVAVVADPMTREVVFILEAPGADADATKAKVVVTPVTDGDEKAVKDAKDVELEVLAYKETALGTLDVGKYTLTVVQAPVLPDGSTYKLPEKPVEFTVTDGDKAQNLTAKLELLKAEDMTKEQLEASAAILDAAGNPEAAADVRVSSEAAESVPGSSDAVSSENPSSDGGIGGGDGGSKTPSSSTPAPTPAPTPDSTPADPNAGKTWHEAVTHQEWVVTAAAWTESVPVYEQQERSICNGCGADITGNTTAHFKAAGRGSACGGWHSEYVQVVTGYTTVNHPEEGYWTTVVDRAAGWY